MEYRIAVILSPKNTTDLAGTLVLGERVDDHSIIMGVVTPEHDIVPIGDNDQPLIDKIIDNSIFNGNNDYEWDDIKNKPVLPKIDFDPTIAIVKKGGETFSQSDLGIYMNLLNTIDKELEPYVMHTTVDGVNRTTIPYMNDEVIFFRLPEAPYGETTMKYLNLEEKIYKLSSVIVHELSGLQKRLTDIINKFWSCGCDPVINGWHKYNLKVINNDDLFLRKLSELADLTHKSSELSEVMDGLVSDITDGNFKQEIFLHDFGEAFVNVKIKSKFPFPRINGVIIGYDEYNMTVARFECVSSNGIPLSVQVDLFGQYLSQDPIIIAPSESLYTMTLNSRYKYTLITNVPLVEVEQLSYGRFNDDSVDTISSGNVFMGDVVRSTSSVLIGASNKDGVVNHHIEMIGEYQEDLLEPYVTDFKVVHSTPHIINDMRDEYMRIYATIKNISKRQPLIVSIHDDYDDGKLIYERNITYDEFVNLSDGLSFIYPKIYDDGISYTVNIRFPKPDGTTIENTRIYSVNAYIPKTEKPKINRDYFRKTHSSIAITNQYDYSYDENSIIKIRVVNGDRSKTVVCDGVFKVDANDVKNGYVHIPLNGDYILEGEVKFDITVKQPNSFDSDRMISTVDMDSILLDSAFEIRDVWDKFSGDSFMTHKHIQMLKMHDSNIFNSYRRVYSTFPINMDLFVQSGAPIVEITLTNNTYGISKTYRKSYTVKEIKNNPINTTSFSLYDAEYPKGQENIYWCTNYLTTINENNHVEKVKEFSKLFPNTVIPLNDKLNPNYSVLIKTFDFDGTLKKTKNFTLQSPLKTIGNDSTLENLVRSFFIQHPEEELYYLIKGRVDDVGLFNRRFAFFICFDNDNVIYRFGLSVSNDGSVNLLEGYDHIDKNEDGNYIITDMLSIQEIMYSQNILAIAENNGGPLSGSREVRFTQHRTAPRKAMLTELNVEFVGNNEIYTDTRSNIGGIINVSFDYRNVPHKNTTIRMTIEDKHTGDSILDVSNTPNGWLNDNKTYSQSLFSKRWIDTGLTAVVKVEIVNDDIEKDVPVLTKELIINATPKPYFSNDGLNIAKVINLDLVKDVRTPYKTGTKFYVKIEDDELSGTPDGLIYETMEAIQTSIDGYCRINIPKTLLGTYVISVIAMEPNSLQSDIYVTTIEFVEFLDESGPDDILDRTKNVVFEYRLRSMFMGATIEKKINDVINQEDTLWFTNRADAHGRVIESYEIYFEGSSEPSLTGSIVGLPVDRLALIRVDDDNMISESNFIMPKKIIEFYFDSDGVAEFTQESVKSGAEGSTKTNLKIDVKDRFSVYWLARLMPNIDIVDTRYEIYGIEYQIKDKLVFRKSLRDRDFLNDVIEQDGNISRVKIITGVVDNISNINLYFVVLGYNDDKPILYDRYIYESWMEYPVSMLSQGMFAKAKETLKNSSIIHNINNEAELILTGVFYKRYYDGSKQYINDTFTYYGGDIDLYFELSPLDPRSIYTGPYKNFMMITHNGNNGINFENIKPSYLDRFIHFITIDTGDEAGKIKICSKDESRSFFYFGDIGDTLAEAMVDSEDAYLSPTEVTNIGTGNIVTVFDSKSCNQLVISDSNNVYSSAAISEFDISLYKFRPEYASIISEDFEYRYGDISAPGFTYNTNNTNDNAIGLPSVMVPMSNSLLYTISTKRLPYSDFRADVIIDDDKIITDCDVVYNNFGERVYLFIDVPLFDRKNADHVAIYNPVSMPKLYPISTENINIGNVASSNIFWQSLSSAVTEFNGTQCSIADSLIDTLPIIPKVTNTINVYGKEFKHYNNTPILITSKDFGRIKVVLKSRNKYNMVNNTTVKLDTSGSRVCKVLNDKINISSNGEGLIFHSSKYYGNLSYGVYMPKECEVNLDSTSYNVLSSTMLYDQSKVNDYFLEDTKYFNSVTSPFSTANNPFKNKLTGVYTYNSINNGVYTPPNISIEHSDIVGYNIHENIQATLNIDPNNTTNILNEIKTILENGSKDTDIANFNKLYQFQSFILTEHIILNTIGMELDGNLTVSLDRNIVSKDDILNDYNYYMSTMLKSRTRDNIVEELDRVLSLNNSISNDDKLTIKDTIINSNNDGIYKNKSFITIQPVNTYLEKFEVNGDICLTFVYGDKLFTADGIKTIPVFSDSLVYDVNIPYVYNDANIIKRFIPREDDTFGERGFNNLNNDGFRNLMIPNNDYGLTYVEFKTRSVFDHLTGYRYYDSTLSKVNNVITGNCPYVYTDEDINCGGKDIVHRVELYTSTVEQKLYSPMITSDTFSGYNTAMQLADFINDIFTSAYNNISKPISIYHSGMVTSNSKRVTLQHNVNAGGIIKQIDPMTTVTSLKTSSSFTQIFGYNKSKDDDGLNTISYDTKYIKHVDTLFNGNGKKEYYIDSIKRFIVIKYINTICELIAHGINDSISEFRIFTTMSPSDITFPRHLLSPDVADFNFITSRSKDLFRTEGEFVAMIHPFLVYKNTSGKDLLLTSIYSRNNITEFSRTLSRSIVYVNNSGFTEKTTQTSWDTMTDKEWNDMNKKLESESIELNPSLTKQQNPTPVQPTIKSMTTYTEDSVQWLELLVESTPLNFVYYCADYSDPSLLTLVMPSDSFDDRYHVKLKVAWDSKMAYSMGCYTDGLDPSIPIIIDSNKLNNAVSRNEFDKMCKSLGAKDPIVIGMYKPGVDKCLPYRRQNVKSGLWLKDKVYLSTIDDDKYIELYYPIFKTNDYSGKNSLRLIYNEYDLRLRCSCSNEIILRNGASFYPSEFLDYSLCVVIPDDNGKPRYHRIF